VWFIKLQLKIVEIPETRTITKKLNAKTLLIFDSNVDLLNYFFFFAKVHHDFCVSSSVNDNQVNFVEWHVSATSGYEIVIFEVLGLNILFSSFYFTFNGYFAPERMHVNYRLSWFYF
jgi:hypothetical protein